jgi:hypothetical protein
LRLVGLKWDVIFTSMRNSFPTEFYVNYRFNPLIEQKLIEPIKTSVYENIISNEEESFNKKGNVKLIVKLVFEPTTRLS